MRQPWRPRTSSGFPRRWESVNPTRLFATTPWQGLQAVRATPSPESRIL
ncbi:hypothetical protein PLANPX_4473 [Lacipirellula parvula]|uniref:Uncharacterized protein n=1 Tax=Lacipirellula parvula TaxID=2650471 RepID=A0A5K7XIQ6_9BACT|nr:hypothetical protein PLANPX_4473 [Lacipirellula parvula]